MFGCVSSVHFQALMMKNYNKGITIRDNGNAQSDDQEEGKLDSTINANSGVHTFTHD